MDTVNWEQVPGPDGYLPSRAREAAGRLAAGVSSERGGKAVADLRFAVSNDHRGTLYPAAVPATAVFLQVIDTMPGSPRTEALNALLDWWGAFGPEPGFETCQDPLGGPAEEVTDGIMRRVRSTATMLERVSREPSGLHHKSVMELLRGLDAGWVPQPLA